MRIALIVTGVVIVMGGAFFLFASMGLSDIKKRWSVMLTFPGFPTVCTQGSFIK